MRRAHNDTQWLVDANGQLQGVALGFDFCSEHEWGIKRIKEAFSVPNKEFPMGIGDRQIGGLPDDLMIFREFTETLKSKGEKRGKKEPFALLAYAQMGTWCKDPAENLKDRALDSARPFDYSTKVSNLGAAWDENSFGIVVKGEADIAKLRELKAAFERNDIAIAPGKQGGFDRSHGLTFVIISRLEPEVFTTVLAADKDHKALMEASEATGIQKRLKTAGRRYFALSPRWANEEKTEVKFWLNPMEQHMYNSCWCTVQDLNDWIAGKGKIVKEEPKEAK
jgi:hypothetical protein